MLPGGVLAVSGPRDTVNLNFLFRAVQEELGEGSDIGLFQSVNRRMLTSGLLKQCLAETQRLLEENNYFTVINTDETISTIRAF